MEGVRVRPPLRARALRVLWHLLPSIGVGVFVFVAARLFDGIPELRAQASAVFFFLLTFGVLWAVACEVLAPNRPKLRVVPLSDLRARRTATLIWWLLLLLLGSRLAIYLLEANHAHPSLPALLRLIRDTGLIVVAWLAIRRTGVLERLVPERVESTWALLRKWLIRFAVPLGVLTLLAYVTFRALGYIGFANWMVGRAQWTVVIVLAVALAHWWIRRWTGRTMAFMRGVEAEAHEQEDAEAQDAEGGVWIAVDRTLRLLLAVAAVVGAGLLTLSIWGVSAADLARGLAQKVPLASQRTWLDLVNSVVQVCVVLLVGRVLHDVLVFAVFPRRSTEYGVRYATVTLLKYAVTLIAVLVGATALGFDASTVAVFAGGAGVGLSFALKDILSNFFSGLILLFGEAVRVGDVVEVGGVVGKVEAIRMRGTVIRALDGNAVILPNQQMIGERLTNRTQGLKVARIEVPVGVSYGSDLEQVEAVLLRQARTMGGVLTEPGPYVRLSGFGDSSVDLQLYCWTDETGHRQRYELQYELRKAVFAAFRRAGIEIPFPQRDVHVQPDQGSTSA